MVSLDSYYCQVTANYSMMWHPPLEIYVLSIMPITLKSYECHTLHYIMHTYMYVGRLSTIQQQIITQTFRCHFDLVLGSKNSSYPAPTLAMDFRK